MFKIADVDVSFFLCNAHLLGRVWSTENKNALQFKVYLKGQIHEIFQLRFFTLINCTSQSIITRFSFFQTFSEILTSLGPSPRANDTNHQSSWS
jgi:hypothetical protein